MPKCGIAQRHGCSPANLLHIFRTLFYKNAYGGGMLLIKRDLKILKF